MPFTSAWCHPGALLVQCGPVVAVRLSCLQRTLASLLKAREMGVRLRSLGPWLEATGLGPTARLPSSGRATNAIHQRMVPPRRSFGSVRSRSGGAPLVPPAHARVAAQGTRDGRALALARAVAWATGLGPTARLPSSGRATNAIHQRMVPPGALLVQCGPVVAVRLSCLQRTLASLLKAREMGVRLRSLGLWLEQRAWGPPPVCRAQDVRPMPFTSAWCHPGALLVQCGPVVAVRLSCLQRTLASLLKAREMGVRLRSLGPVAWATGLGPTARLPSSGRATNAIHQRMVPPRRSFGSVRSRSGGAPLVPPAHARVAAQGTRDGRALALARPVA